MKCLTLKEYGRFEYGDIAYPQPAAEEAVVRVHACAICGSDVHGMDGATGRRIPPIIMGHEASGVIEAVGASVNAWKPGDRVTFDSTVYCGRCGYCRQGRINLCDNRRVLGVSCDAYRCQGAFAEYVAVPQHILYRLPDSVSFVQATMVEPLSIALHAATRAPRRLNDSAVVVGAGMIGLLLIQTLRVSGMGRIYAIDIDEERLRLAARLGADMTLCATDVDVSEAIRRETDGGADHAFEVVGTSEAMQSALRCVRKGGTLTLVGNITPTVELPLQEVVTREVTLLGSCASAGEYPACLDLIGRGRINVAPLISAVAPLSEGAAWFQRLYNREPGLMKVILCPVEGTTP